LLKKINDYLYKVSDIKFILIMLISSFLIIIPLEPILILIKKLFGESDGSTILKLMSFLWKIIIVSLLVPLIETLLWQKLPIEILQKKKNFLDQNLF
jgi:membrane protease YdiL (CAAX protease family)